MYWLLAIAFAMASARAHCPLCTAAAGAGLAAARFYGVDDMVVGLWFGAFILSTALWFSRSIKKNIVKFQAPLIVLASFLITIAPMYSAGVMGSPQHSKYFMLPNGSLFGVDRLLLGMLLGVGLFLGAEEASKQVKKRRGLLFPFQTIVFIMVALSIASAAFLLV